MKDMFPCRALKTEIYTVKKNSSNSKMWSWKAEHSLMQITAPEGAADVIDTSDTLPVPG